MQALKKLYRSLAVKLHPDATLKSGKAFVQLQEEYEEARLFLRGKNAKDETTTGTKHNVTLDPRTAFLRALYVFAIN